MPTNRRSLRLAYRCRTPPHKSLEIILCGRSDTSIGRAFTVALKDSSQRGCSLEKPSARWCNYLVLHSRSRLYRIVLSYTTHLDQVRLDYLCRSSRSMIPFRRMLDTCSLYPSEEVSHMTI